MPELLTEDFLYPASYDQTQQPARGLAAKNPNRPLLVILHPWSWGYRHQNSPAVEQWCVENDWNLVHPHFRGPSSNNGALKTTGILSIRTSAARRGNRSPAAMTPPCRISSML